MELVTGSRPGHTCSWPMRLIRDRVARHRRGVPLRHRRLQVVLGSLAVVSEREICGLAHQARARPTDELTEVAYTLSGSLTREDDLWTTENSNARSGIVWQC